MNKTAIKNFAIWARNKLIADISYRAGLMGITEDGIHSALPQSTGKTEFYDIGTAEPYAITGEAIRQRKHLVELIQRKEKDTNYKTAYKYIIEEVAYTWFNRLIAVRFMEVNDYLPSHIRVLSSDSGKLEPDIVTTPFDAELEFTRDEQQTVLDLKNANKLDEVFRLLFIKQCNALNEILPAIFEKTNDYSELLLNLSVIDQDSMVYHLVHDIPEEDFDVERGGQVEIIGWLYQYYNTEPKEWVFSDLKKNIKISKEKIPAATQLFTPDWIVRYMVENSLGRLWVEGHRNDQLKANWKYYLEEAEQQLEVQTRLAEVRAKYAKLNPEDIKVVDPCMGSGHILVYAFDVLIQIYESAGYGQRDAARSILENNLYGLDIDDRAFQIAFFAVMMKARQYNRRILNGDYKPNLYSVQESNDINRNQLKCFGAGMSDKEKEKAVKQIAYLLDTFKDAKEYGSILNVNPCDWRLLRRFVSNIEVMSQLSFETVGIGETKEKLLHIIYQGEILSRKYDITITNPPYMGASGMGNMLGQFIKKNYPDSKSDMSTVCMERCISFCDTDRFIAMINIPVWMFLSSYEKLRKKLLNTSTITNMVHPGRGVFGSDFGTTSFIICKNRIEGYKATYHRLFDSQGEVENNEARKSQLLERKGKYYAKQDDFIKIPGAPIAYWVSDNVVRVYSESKLIKDYADTRQGIATGENERFLRIWYEPSFNNVACPPERTGKERKKYKWYPYHKGGEFRKWYGNNDYIVNWSNDGQEIRNFYDSKGKLRSRPQNLDFAFKKCVTWSLTNSSSFGARFRPEGYMFDINGMSLFIEDRWLYYALGFLCSNVATALMRINNPTLASQAGDIARLPFILDESKLNIIDRLVKRCIQNEKADWDSYETSWDFVKHPLIGKFDLISDAYKSYEGEQKSRFEQIKKDEEELNELYIQIYGLIGEMSPEVLNKDITLKPIDASNTIRSLIAYAVGCMFGRYSLDIKGLVYAGGKWESDKYASFIPDDDSIIPITDEEYLEDDIVSRLCEWIKVVYGEQNVEENLDFIAKTLGNRGGSSREIIRNYFLNDFFRDHCQTYSVTGSGKRPIYWLFDSGKQNGFKALIYLHRYTPDTIGNLRIDYLHRMQRVYESEISRMQDMIEHSTNAREVGQATKRRDKLTKQLKECREYDEKLAHLALSRIELDLDDGVKVNYRKIQTANDGKFYEVLADSKKIMSKK